MEARAAREDAIGVGAVTGVDATGGAQDPDPGENQRDLFQVQRAHTRVKL